MTLILTQGHLALKHVKVIAVRQKYQEQMAKTETIKEMARAGYAGLTVNNNSIQ